MRLWKSLIQGTQIDGIKMASFARLFQKNLFDNT